jgi:hypothetical protein
MTPIWANPLAAPPPRASPMTGFLTMIGGVTLMTGGVILGSGAGFVGGKEEQEVRTIAPRIPKRVRRKVLLIK